MLNVIFTSLPLALLFLWPSLAQRIDGATWDGGFLKVPATGLDYMAVFFHEIGHTVTRWAFGYAAIPTFDFEDGGGMTYGLDRSMAMQYFIWVMMAAGLAWLYKNGGRLLFYIACGIALFLFLLSFSAKHEALAVYMGHGGEILVASFCILRALTGTTERSYGSGERYLNMIFGLYVYGRNLILCHDLMFSDTGVAAYDMQKNGHVQGDFRVLAETLNIHIGTAAALSLAFMLAMLAVTAFFAWWLREESV